MDVSFLGEEVGMNSTDRGLRGMGEMESLRSE